MEVEMKVIKGGLSNMLDTQVSVGRKEFDVKNVGFGTGLAGMFMSSLDGAYIITFPDEHSSVALPLEYVTPTQEEFEAIIHQMDTHEIELFNKNTNAKIIVRKSQRNMDQNIVWQVFRRDNFTCRYCGEDKMPMTYDHVMLWEDDGDTTLMNGVCACRKCNKTRGNLSYKDWLESTYYLEVSKDLPDSIKEQNRILGVIYTKFPKKISGRKR